jgi:hypothetical protein
MTLGWILANRPDKAAHIVYDSSILGNRGATAPIHWYEEQFAAVATEIRMSDEFQRFTSRSQELARSLSAALQRLDKGMLYIRDRYEGGAPVV